MASTRIRYEPALYDLLGGIVAQARRDLAPRRRVPPSAQDSALDLFGAILEVREGVSRPKPDITRGPRVGTQSSADVRT